MDVITAFLHGLVDVEIYMAQPEGFITKEAGHMVGLLLRSLYGLKQSPRQWNKQFDSFMLSKGFTCSDFDSCIYMKEVENFTSFGYIVLALYVNDMLIAAENKSNIAHLKAMLSKEFSMKDLGQAKKILGMEIHRDREKRQLWLSQRQYVEKMLAKYGMENAKPVSTPLASHFKLSQKDYPSTESERIAMQSIPYDSVVGSLMYAMTCTRPGIAHAVSVVSRVMANPGKPHWEAVKWILRYLRGTLDYGILFDGRTNSTLELGGYVDSDYAENLDNRKSTTGDVFMLGGGCISWKLVNQSCVALSTTEAEYMAACEATKELIWLQRLVHDLGLSQERPELLCDSQSALHLAKNRVFHARTKHIDIRYHFIREALEKKQIFLEKVASEDNAAYMLTKVLSSGGYLHCVDLLNVRAKPDTM
ncbi:unnamed protein product [Calypogeia fissa]